ncbi:MAG: hypothetical protein NC310_06195 [Roseburia sp.]|nr:hypothetical protein [Anaeroplasma bactoclasticum]MCM1196640.1 hypothetical protein [Roseburia sp.]MCM1557524.1 hypothetical protein [Anaeroplasma bactoclasticum]
MFKALEKIFKFLFRFSNMKDKAKRIKEDEEKRQKSIYFGVESISYSIASTAMCILGAWLFSAFMDTALVLFTLIIGIAFMIGGILTFIWALVGWILQLSINKKWIGWFAMLVFIAGLIVSVILVIGQMSSMS